MNELKPLLAIFILLVPLSIGILFTFFPGRIIRFWANSQKKIFHNISLSNADIDKLPIYSALYKNKFSKSLDSQIKEPEKHKFFMLWFRIIGIFSLVITFSAICLLVLAMKAGPVP